jgi:transposase
LGAGIQLIIGEDYSIQWVYAMFVPVSAEMYKAFANPMISEKDATKIIERQFKADGITYSEIPVSKKLIDKPPYVIWRSTGYLDKKHRAVAKRGSWRWYYTINAFTGDVLSKYIGPYE